ncbi:unnamed protein product [Arabis nemorensis]|uniref:Uncharacterized protein n=1 Tax=Arabis nemorensis TaxID=586526 RepID=A0A565BQR9_9BRAS|nr:unnamed protein product [Arabis nemorensis]
MMEDELMETRSTSAVLRRIRPLAGSYRYYPYQATVSGKEDIKKEVVQLGVELSLSKGCFLLFNGVYHDGGKSVQWELIRTTWTDFADGIIVLHRLHMLLRRKVCSFEDRLLSSAIQKCKQQVLKKLEDKLSPANHVSKANGFARETIKSVIFDLWRSLFDEELISNERRIGIVADLFTPLLGKPERREIRALPVCSPYILGKDFAMQELKQEVVQLGVELSLYVAQSMFLLCDDTRTMLEFCFMFCKGVLRYRNPVLERLLLVIHYVYSNEIKPKNGVYQDGGDSVQWELIRTTWKDFADGIIVLDRLDKEFRRKVSSFDDRQLLSAIQKYKLEVLKKLDDKLSSVKEVLEANGFARETIESIIFDLWKSLFDEDATSQEIRSRILVDMFMPLKGKRVQALPVCSPYILGKDFKMQEVKVEVVRLGVELSLYVAESMFLLCDDIRTVLWFCHNLWGETIRDVINENHVTDRLLRVMHHVYTKYIKRKNGVYNNDGKNSVQWKLIRTTVDHLAFGFRELDRVVLLLRGGGTCGRESTSIIEEAVKKIEEKLWRVKVVSEVNGFARAVMVSNILDLWKSLFDEEAKEATLTLKAIKSRIIRQLFVHLFNEVAAL